VTLEKYLFVWGDDRPILYGADKLNDPGIPLDMEGKWGDNDLSEIIKETIQAIFEIGVI
jgi:hypothetical protein